MSDYTIWDLFEDVERAALRKEAAARIAQMPETERYFMLGLLRHEEAAHGQAGIERVIKWIAEREQA